MVLQDCWSSHWFILCSVVVTFLLIIGFISLFFVSIFFPLLKEIILKIKLGTLFLDNKLKIIVEKRIKIIGYYEIS